MSHRDFECPVCRLPSKTEAGSYRTVRFLRQHAFTNHGPLARKENAMQRWDCYSRSCGQECIIGEGADGRITIEQLRQHYKEKHVNHRLRQLNNEGDADDALHDDEEMEEAVPIGPEPVMEVTVDIRGIIRELFEVDPEDSLINQVQTYQFVLETGLTEDQYSKLIKLKDFKDERYEPKFKPFVKYWREALGCVKYHEAIFIMNGTKTKEVVCLLALDTTFGMWLSSPELLRQARQHRDDFLNDEILGNIDEEVRIAHERKHIIPISNIGDTPLFKEVARDTMPLWNGNKAIADYYGIETIFFFLNKFTDGFSWKGKVSSKGLWDWQLTASQFNRATRGNARSIANVVLMLGLSSILKGRGTLHKIKRNNGVEEDPPVCDNRFPNVVNQLYDLLLRDAMPYAHGKFMQVGGRKFLVIAVWHLLVTDLPGGKGALLLSESVRNILGGCRMCLCRKGNFADCILDKTLRCERTWGDFSTLKEMCSLDSLVDGPTLLRYMLRIGTVGYSHLMNLPGILSPKQVPIDAMHAYFTNEVLRLLKYLISIFTSNAAEVKTFCKKLSKHFQAYVALNHLKCSYGFYSAKSFSNALHSHGAKIFLEALPFILINLEAPFLLDLVNKEKHRIGFKYCLLLRNIARIMTYHVITPENLRIAKAHTIELLHLLEFTLDDSRLNTHVFLHLIEHCPDVGAPRDYWAFSFEGVHPWLKLQIVNTNNRGEAQSCFERYLYLQYLSLVGMLDVERRLSLDYTSGTHHSFRSRVQFPLGPYYSIMNHRKVFTNFWNVTIVPPIDILDMEEDEVVNRLDSFEFCLKSKGKNALAVICYREINLRSYIMLRETLEIGKIVLFLRARLPPTGEKYGYYVAFNKPAVTYAPRLEYEYLEVREISVQLDLTNLFIVPVENIFSVPVKVITKGEERLRITASEPLYWEM